MARKNRQRKEIEYSRHHKIAKSRDGANVPPNNERIRHEVHKAIHLVFGNRHTIEKIDTLVSMDYAILTDEFKRAVFDLLAMTPQDIYKMEAFRSKHGYEKIGSDIQNKY